MTNDNIQYQRIVFPLEETDPVISEILKKYNLEETVEEVFKKRKISNKAVLIQFTKKFVSDKLPDKELSSLLQKGLNVAKESAERMTQDIKIRLIPLAKKVTIIENTPGETEETTSKPLVSLLDSSAMLKPEEPIIFEEPSISKRPLIKKPMFPNEEFSTKIKEIKKTPGKADTYREPIE